MEILTAIISSAMVSIFVQNAIFERAFGSNVAIYASRKETHVSGFTIGITAMTTIASIISYLFDGLILPFKYGWLFMPLIYVAIISLLYIVALLLLWRFLPKIFARIKNTLT